MSERRPLFARFFLPLLAVAALLLTALFVVEFAAPARALPSYARQTGQPCGTCHTDFAGLTPYGRRFKIGGYTAGGGQYRTTLFPFDDSTRDSQKKWVPPISMMSVVGFTHTKAEASPPTDPFAPNDNVTITPLSFFWGGAITDHIGAFAQVTYNGPPVTANIVNDPFVHSWTWDNTDVRYTDSTSLGDLSVTYGITANNGPTVQDPWNTTPAWGFPYASSPIAPTPATHTIINGTFAAHVGSVGGYAYINDLIYLEASVYRTIDPNAQNALGTDPFKAPGLFDFAPYWRAAIEPHWGPHWLELGTFGMIADVHAFAAGPSAPGTAPPLPAVTTATFPQAVKFTDIGVDTQYQYQGDNFWFTLRGSYIHETQKYDPNLINVLAANSTDTLNEVKAYASLAYGNNHRIVLTGQYFNTWGNPDPVLYASLASGVSPNSDGWIAEIAYIPFVSSFAPAWPWFNTRIGLQYTWYHKFDGTNVGASSNNTLFAYLWLAM
jgi:hypothetical protein